MLDIGSPESSTSSSREEEEEGGSSTNSKQQQQSGSGGGSCEAAADQEIEAIMAAHLFNDNGQLEEVDIPELFEVLAGGDADEGTFKFLMEFAGNEGSGGGGGESGLNSGTVATSSSSAGVSAGSSGCSGSGENGLNDVDLSTDLESVFDCQMLGTLETPPLSETAQSSQMDTDLQARLFCVRTLPVDFAIS